MRKYDAKPTRREMIGVSLAAVGGVPLALNGSAAAFASQGTVPPEAADHARDWDWLVGKWNVRHHRLKVRLAGNTEWEEFKGTCTMWPTMGGLGNVDDNVLELPSGTYRAVGLRAFDPATQRWAIWWLDERNPTHIEPPVYGSFKNGAGVFLGEDTFNGNPIQVRFTWSEITRNSARWEQAFSPDGGASWEVNWKMEFSRASPQE